MSALYRVFARALARALSLAFACTTPFTLRVNVHPTRFARSPCVAVLDCLSLFSLGTAVRFVFLRCSLTPSRIFSLVVSDMVFPLFHGVLPELAWEMRALEVGEWRKPLWEESKVGGWGERGGWGAMNPHARRVQERRRKRRRKREGMVGG